MTIEEQKRLITEYRASTPYLCEYEFMGVTIDDAASAKPKRFLDRPNARALSDRMQQGDQFVVAAMDRGWHTFRDCVRCYDMWTERGISVHILDFEDGDVTILRQVARTERLHWLERYALRGTPLHWRPGFRWLGRKGKKRWVRNEAEQKLMREAREMSEHGFTADRIAHIFTMRGELVQVGKRRKRPWTEARVQRVLRDNPVL